MQSRITVEVDSLTELDESDRNALKDWIADPGQSPAEMSKRHGILHSSLMLVCALNPDEGRRPDKTLIKLLIGSAMKHREMLVDADSDAAQSSLAEFMDKKLRKAAELILKDAAEKNLRQARDIPDRTGTLPALLCDLEQIDKLGIIKEVNYLRRKAANLPKKLEKNIVVPFRDETLPRYDNKQLEFCSLYSYEMEEAASPELEEVLVDMQELFKLEVRRVLIFELEEYLKRIRKNKVSGKRYAYAVEWISSALEYLGPLSPIEMDDHDRDENEKNLVEVIDWINGYYNF